MTTFIARAARVSVKAAPTAATVDKLVAALTPIPFKKVGDEFVAKFKFSEKKTADNDKIEAKIEKVIAKFNLKHVSSTRNELNNYSNKGVSGERVFAGEGVELGWQRSYSYSNGTTYHSVRVSPT